jgi:uncharacterized protein (TIGR02246 family)
MQEELTYGTAATHRAGVDLTETFTVAPHNAEDRLTRRKKPMAARRPEEIDQLFVQAFSAGNLEALVALYEPDAALVPQRGQVVTGREAIRDALQGFLTLCGEFRVEVKSVVETGGLALVRSDWSLVGTAPGGCLVNLSGRASEVIRRQPDGTWLYVIDDPYAGD